MPGELLTPSRTDGADAIVLPNVGAAPTVLPEPKVVDVGSVAGFPHEDELVLATVEAAHATVGLDPDNEVFELTINGVAGGHHLGDMPPIHADIMDRTVAGVSDQAVECRFQEIRESF